MKESHPWINIPASVRCRPATLIKTSVFVSSGAERSLKQRQDVKLGFW